MNIYKRKKFMNKFIIENEEIIKCPNNKVPYISEKSSDYKNLVGFFDVADCDKCIDKKKCIFEKYDNVYNKAIVDIEEKEIHKLKKEIAVPQVSFSSEEELMNLLKLAVDFEVGDADKLQLNKGKKYENGEISYDGEYLDNYSHFYCHGYGKCYYEGNKLEYEGEFKYGCPHGKGIYYYRNGNIKWEGTFEGIPGFLELGQYAFSTSEGYIDRRGRIKCGKYYNEKGDLIFEGNFNLGIPIPNKSEKEVEILYNKAKELMNRRQGEEAVKILNELIKEPLNKYTGGACVNLAEIKFANKFESSVNEIRDGKGICQDKEIENLYLRALDIKKHNQVALSGIAIYYFYLHDYSKSLKYFKLLEDGKNLSRYLDMISDLDINFNFYKLTNKSKKLDYNSLIVFYNNVLLSLNERHINYLIKIKVLLANYYLESDRLLEAYDCLKNLEHNYINSIPGLMDIINELLAFVCCPTNLNRTKESLEYYRKVKKPTSKSVHNSNIALCFLELNEVEKTIEILETQLKENPNNTDFHNLARAYYIKGDYEKALNNIECALSLYEDETSYIQAAIIKKELGEADEAIELAKKSLFFLENSELDFISKNDDSKTISFIPQGQLDKKYIDTYDNLSNCYIAGKRFEEAFAINKIAIEKYPYEIIFKEKNNTLKQFINITEETKIIKENMEILEREKEEFKIQSITARQWMEELIKSKQKYENIDDLDNKSWAEFEKSIQNIIEEMKADAKKTNVNYNEIYLYNEDIFKKLSKEALACLSTAEYLYQCNKESLIDFAPIVVELSKVFEIELNLVLKYPNSKTLGQILLDESIIDSYMLAEILDEVEKIRVLRNGSAHISLSKKKKVDEIRNIIYNTDILNKLTELK